MLRGSQSQCQYRDKAALTPYSISSLQCVPGTKSSMEGQCLLGPQKAGDGCSLPQECASGNCAKELRVCTGTDEGQGCTAAFPDPCTRDHYCQAASGSTGICARSVSPGNKCFYPPACTRGFFCSGPDLSFTNARCLPAFSVPTGVNTTIGPYMCITGNALIVQAGTSLETSVYQCVVSNTSAIVGTLCDSRVRSPVGFECKCAADGQNRLRTIMGLGLGGRSKVWNDLYSCLLTATGPMGDPCLFDSTDLTSLRYGSCPYYACYPHYLALANATAGRTFAPPLAQFAPTAECETASATSFFSDMASAPCIVIPHLENWKCASLLPPQSLSVQATGCKCTVAAPPSTPPLNPPPLPRSAGVIAFIFIIMGGGYMYHMYHFRNIIPIALAHPVKSHPWD